MNDKYFEENTVESVNIAQQLEIAILLAMLVEFEKVANGGNQAESTNNLRKEVEKETNTFQNAIKLAIASSLLKVGNDTLKDLKNAEKIEYYGLKDSIDNIKKYVKSKGFVLNGQSLETYFYNLCRDEAKAVVEGTTTLEKAIEKACNKLGNNGVSIVTYDKTTRKIDVYVRQELLYAQKQSYQDIIFKYAEDNGVTVYETDAHADARQTHQVWQGRRWDTTGELYPTFDQLSHGNGDYNDYNCLHVVSPVLNPDSKEPYTEKQLKNINTKPFTYRGKTYDGYEAKQHMRYIERNIRACKREKILLDKMGMDNTKVSQRLKNWQSEYKNFCKAYGTYQRTNRTRVYTE